jgi:hypothetical protein
MTEKRVKLNELKLGPIRHQQLPPALVTRIEWLRLTLHEACPQSTEKWLDGFQRDVNPEPELVWWERLAHCYVEYSRRNELNGDKKMAAFKVILKLALGASEMDADLADLPVGALDEIQEIMRRASH